MDGLALVKCCFIGVSEKIVAGFLEFHMEHTRIENSISANYIMKMEQTIHETAPKNLKNMILYLFMDK